MALLKPLFMELKWYVPGLWDPDHFQEYCWQLVAKVKDFCRIFYCQWNTQPRVMHVISSHNSMTRTGHIALQFSSVQSLSRVRLFATPWIAARQASLSITNSWSLLKLMSIESVMSSNHLILCHPLLLLPSIFPSIRVFSSESVLCIRWPKYWSFRFSINPSTEYSRVDFL